MSHLLDEQRLLPFSIDLFENHKILDEQHYHQLMLTSHCLRRETFEVFLSLVRGLFAIIELLHSAEVGSSAGSR